MTDPLVARQQDIRHFILNCRWRTAPSAEQHIGYFRLFLSRQSADNGQLHLLWLPGFEQGR